MLRADNTGTGTGTVSFAAGAADLDPGQRLYLLQSDELHRAKRLRLEQYHHAAALPPTCW